MLAGKFSKIILKMLSIRDTFFSYRNQVYEGLHETITKTNPQQSYVLGKISYIPKDILKS